MLEHWIWFAQLNKLSNAKKQMLLQHFSDPEDIYNCKAEEFSDLEGITAAALEALENKDLLPARQILNRCKREGIGILTLDDENYPSRLRNTFDPPLVLYFKGNLPQWEAQPAIAVVGTRKASGYGLSMAGWFGKQIAACGGLVVSGAAAGIDAMAMEGAIQAGAPVVGILGCGVDRVYPASNKDLFRKTLQQGCLISEYPPGTEPRSWHFPERNRIITGLSNGVLVVEAPEKSGAMISARCALEQGREVFVVPGNLDNPNCAGSNALLQDRAMPALSGWDIMKEYQHRWPKAVTFRQVEYSAPTEAPLAPACEKTTPKAQKLDIDKEEKSTYIVLDKPLPELSRDEKTILELLSKTPIAMDDVIAGSQMNPAAVKAILTKLSLKRLVVNHSGNRVSLK